MHVGGFPRRFQAILGSTGIQGPLGASRGLQGPPGASRGLQQAFTKVLNEKCAQPWARLKFHAGWSGWTRPPTMAGGGGGGAEMSAQGGGGF